MYINEIKKLKTIKENKLKNFLHCWSLKPRKNINKQKSKNEMKLNNSEEWKI